MTGIALKPNATGTAFELDLTDGKMKLMEVTHQNQAMLLMARPGEFKEFPTMGVGLPDILLDHDLNGWRRRIIEQLEADGQRITRIKVTTQGVDLEATYK